MTATAALIAATLLAVPFWPVPGRDGAESALQEVSDVHGMVMAVANNGKRGAVGAPLGATDSEHVRGSVRSSDGGGGGSYVVGVTEHPCEVAGACYVWDLDATSPAIPITKDEGEFAVRVWLGCEVKGPVLTPYVRLADVPNSTGSGAMGQAQVMPLHAPRMATLGLDYAMEYHRVLYAFSMYRASGDRPWSCAR